MAMAKKPNLPKFTLGKNKQNDSWDLTRNADKKVVKSFGNKGDATAGGVLKRAIGGEGSVVIKTE